MEKQVNKYMIDLQFTLHTIEYSKHQHTRRIIKEFDDLQKKSSFKLYRKYKKCIRDEQDVYDNSATTTTLFRERTGTLKLNIERSHTDAIHIAKYVILMLQKI